MVTLIACKLQTLNVYWQTGGWRSLAFRIAAIIRRRCQSSSFHAQVGAVSPPADVRSCTDSLAVLGRTIVYTAVIGDYDALLPFEFDDIEAICFTDRPEAVPAGWLAVNVSGEMGVRQARQIKVLSHNHVSDAKWSIWMDGNLQLKVHPHEIVRRLAARRAELGSFLHPERQCSFAEAKVVQHLALDDRRLVEQQVEHYEKEGFPSGFGLLETAIVARRNSSKVRELNELWWQEICLGSHRDQLSIMYALWKTKLPFCTLPGSRDCSRLCRLYSHRSGQTSGNAAVKLNL